MAQLQVISSLARFLWKKKMWWLLPIALLLVIVIIIILIGQNSVISPFVYTLF